MTLIRSGKGWFDIILDDNSKIIIEIVNNLHKIFSKLIQTAMNSLGIAIIALKLDIQ